MNKANAKNGTTRIVPVASAASIAGYCALKGFLVLNDVGQCESCGEEAHGHAMAAMYDSTKAGAHE